MVEPREFSVFALMPLSEEFRSVFDDFVKAVFEDIDEAQFTVTLASDIQNQQSILQDIVARIARSDLIVADLTDRNPNVFYELGLAHALQRPVILLTQDIEDVPFDLKPYRILEYSTHFAKIQIAEATLRDYAQKFARNEIQFGSPVSDYHPDIRATPAGQLTQQITSQGDEGDERGFLDHIIDVVEDYNALAIIATDLTTAMGRDVTTPIGMATGELERLASGGRMAEPRAAQAVARRLARHITGFNESLKEGNASYSEILQRTEFSLEFVAQFVTTADEQREEELKLQFDQLRKFRDTALNTRKTCIELAETADELPRIERRLNRALADLSDQLRHFGSNLERTVASVTRALNIWESRHKSQ